MRHQSVCGRWRCAQFRLCLWGSRVVVCDLHACWCNTFKCRSPSPPPPIQLHTHTPPTHTTHTLPHTKKQVLFDVLKCHGGSFAESFWSRIFDRVLLPIFDHVRAEVTDTTTFTSERRRQQEDAWLYETCTHCLQVCREGCWGSSGCVRVLCAGVQVN